MFSTLLSLFGSGSGLNVFQIPNTSESRDRWAKVFGSTTISKCVFKAYYMYNITLVSTHHSELGKCNSDELYKIIDSIKPDVIFEELTQELFVKFYEIDIIPYESPEIKAVKRYLRIHNIKHIPVDIDGSQNLFTSEIENMFNIFKKYSAYSRLEEEQIRLILQEGFDFLNSKKNENLFDKRRLRNKV